jgi:2,4-dienoyl-CoA reductase-like NADH-dependent reductase (Old Yellow Enzyme family)
MYQSLLFTPLKLRGVTLRNRVVVSPMCQYQAIDGLVQDWHYAHHARFALGGVGAAFVEATAVSPEGRITFGCTGLWSDAQIAGLERIARLYKAYGAVPGIQIGHAGRRASCARPWDGALSLTGGGTEMPWPIMGPSAVPERQGSPAPREMNEADIETVVGAFRGAFLRAMTAGFQILEIHGAHGYLIHSFFSPVSNRRTDAFGGSLERRMRFPLMIAEAARSIWPSDRPIFYRMSVLDGVEGGVTIDESVALASALVSRGIDVIDCSSGGISGPSVLANKEIAPGYQVPLAEAIRRRAKCTTMAVGAILDGPQGEYILRQGSADLIAIGREMLADPNWCLHAAQALGVENRYTMLPKLYSFYLERRDKILKRGVT